MATEIKATTKNSPSLKVGKNPDNGPAEEYAGRYIEAMPELDSRVDRSKLENLSMTVNGICKTVGDQHPKTSGIKIRGTGAAIKGIMSRGPMA
jgi:hypothetical protein